MRSLKTAIIYTRVSTEDQARYGYSLADQLAQCKAKAQELEIPRIIECIDEGISGDVLERPGLSKARELIRSEDIPIFICFDPDRLSRKLAHQLLLTDEIERSGCKLLFINFDWQNTPEGRLFYSLRGAIAEFEKEKIRERTMRGLRQKAKQGGLTHDPRAFGYSYNKESNCLAIIPEEASIYLMISQWFLKEGLGYSGIANRLTNMGIPTKRGAQSWSATTIARMLKNPLYKGELWLQRYNTSGKKSNKYRSTAEKVKITEHPKEYQILINVPPIIDNATFNTQLQQSQRISRLYKKRSFHGDYLLSGLLRCTLCGSAMSGTRSGQRKYYRCNKKGQITSCDLPYIQADALEKSIWDTIISWLIDPIAIQNAATIWLAETRTTFEQTIAKDKHKEALKERTRLIQLVQKGLVPLEEIQEQLTEVNARINKLSFFLLEHKTLEQATPPQVQAHPSTVEQRLGTLTFGERQKIIRDLIESVLISPDTIVIRTLFLTKD